MIQPGKPESETLLCRPHCSVGMVLAAILILGIGFLGWTNKQGFLGTYAPIIADVNLIAQIALLRCADRRVD